MKNQKGLAALFKEGSWTSPSWSFLWLVFRDSPHALWLLSMHAAFAGPPPPKFHNCHPTSHSCHLSPLPHLGFPSCSCHLPPSPHRPTRPSALGCCCRISLSLSSPPRAVLVIFLTQSFSRHLSLFHLVDPVSFCLLGSSFEDEGCSASRSGC